MSGRSDRKKKSLQTGDTLYYGSLESPIGAIYVAIDGDRVMGLSFTSESEAPALIGR
jgi:hypothetical protein